MAPYPPSTRYHRTRARTPTLRCPRILQLGTTASALQPRRPRVVFRSSSSIQVVVVVQGLSCQRQQRRRLVIPGRVR